MKKNFIISSALCCFPFFAYAAKNDHQLSSSTSVVIGTFFQWALMITIPLLILIAIILGIKHFLKKDTKNKKELPASNVGIIIRLIIPYCIFAGMFVFSKHLSGGYACECFANDYEKIIADMTALLFLVISIGLAYFMKKDKKEWKILHTLLIIISFLVTFYSIMTIGQYFYGEM